MKDQIRFTLTASFAIVVGLGAASCGSDDGSGDGGLLGAGAAAATGGSGGSSVVTFGGSGGTTAGSGTHDGGSIDLTDEDVAAIADAACTGWSSEGEQLPAVLQLVVDVSGSMEDPAPGSNNLSKWDVTREALRDALTSLPDSVSVGILYYPNQNVDSSDNARPVDACVNVDEIIPIDILGVTTSQQRGTLDQSLSDARTGDLTPTHDAYKYALEESLIPYQTQANKFMLLITDGAPTMRLECIGQTGGGVMDQPTDPIIADIGGAFDQGIRTFLIGSPGSQESSESGTDMRPWLSHAAIEGGTAPAGCDADGPDYCHMDMTQEPDFAKALADGLASVVGQVIDSCTFVIPPPPSGETIDPGLTNLIINWGAGGSSLILPDDTGDCSEGWQFDADGQIVLCSATCDQVQADGGATLQLTFGCGVQDVIPVR